MKKYNGFVVWDAVVEMVVQFKPTWNECNDYINEALTDGMNCASNWVVRGITMDPSPVQTELRI